MTKSSPTAIVGAPIHFPFSGLTAPNRTLKSAMTERLCTYSEDDLEARGHVTPEYIKLYQLWGEGQIGVIVLGNLPIEREALEAKKNMIIDKSNPWNPAEELKPVIQACKAHGSLVIGQLTHGGRQTSEEIVKTPRSSSDVQAPPMGGMTFGKPKPLNEDEIEDIIDRFAYGAEQLYKAGADGCQLHGAHGYLLSQFLSSRVNKRTDQWGGDLDNKSRIVFRIIDEIKKRVPAAAKPNGGFMVSMKLNSADFSDGGFNQDESKQVCQMLQAQGVDLVELSGGSYESMAFEHKKESTKKREAFFIEFADQIRPSLDKSVLCVTGGFRSISAMAEAIDGGSCSMVGIARPLCAEPHFVADLLSGKITEAKPNLVPSALSVPAAYMQLGAIGAGKTPLDLSVQEQADEAVKIITGGAQQEEKKPVKDQEISGGNYSKAGQHQQE